MYIVTYVEHIKALEGLNEGTELGRRSGKNGGQIVQCFKTVEDAKHFCENIQEEWSKGEDLESVRAMWYEIWDYPICGYDESSHGEDFIAAYNRYGDPIEAAWTPDYSQVLLSEDKDLGKKLAKESTLTVEMSPADLMKFFADAIRSVVDDKFAVLNDKINSLDSILSGIRGAMQSYEKLAKEKKRGKSK